MPTKSIEETFRKKYGDKVEIISSDFFTESGNRHMEKYEKMLARQVRLYNRLPFIGFSATSACEFLGREVASRYSVRVVAPFACKSQARLIFRPFAKGGLEPCIFCKPANAR